MERRKLFALSTAMLALVPLRPLLAQDSNKPFSNEQLDQLLAPVALYPDALLAQVLMAATYPLEIVEIFDNYEFGTEVLVASVRSPMHVVAAARMGADVCTCPAAVLESLFKHPLTDIGIERFLKDWEKAQQKLAAK